MKIWLTTDSHFGHKNIINFGRPENFEEKIFKGYMNIPKDDILIHLGDICLSHEEEIHKKYIMPIPCHKWLVLGNHDHKSYNWYLDHGWEFVCEMFYAKYFGQHILFSHTPKSKRSIGFWSYNIHGHLHDNIHRFPEYKNILTRKHLLLSLEQTNYQPVYLESFLKSHLTKDDKTI